MIRKAVRMAAALTAALVLPSCLEDPKTVGAGLAAPSGLSGTAAADGTSILLTWTDHSIGESGFRVDVAPDPIAADADVTEYAEVGADVTAYAYPTLPNTTRYFRVLAITATHQSGPSNVISVSTPNVPMPPSNFVANVGPTSDKDALLTWSDRSDETGYRLERSLPSGVWSNLALLPFNTTSYSDATTAYDAEYQYRIRASNAQGDGPPSTIEKVQTRSTSWSLQRFSAPAGEDVSWFSSIAVAPDGTADCSHYDATNGDVWHTRFFAQGFSMGYPIDLGFPESLGATGTSIAREGSGALHIVANDIAFNGLYHLTQPSGWVATRLGDSSISDRALIKLSREGPHVIYQIVSTSGTQLRHAWLDLGSWRFEPVSSDQVPDTFALSVDRLGAVHVTYRRPSTSGNYELVHALKPRRGSWFTEVITTSGNPEFSSVALDSAGFVHVAYNELTTFGLHYATNVSGSWTTEPIHQTRGGSWGRFNSIAVDPSTGHIHVAYSDMLYENLRYARKDAAGPWHLKLIDAVGTVGRWPSIGLDEAGGVYISYGDLSNGDLKVARNSPFPVTNFSATPVSSSRIDLSWADSPNESSYMVQRSLAAGGPWADVATLPSGATTFSDTGLSIGTDYWYRVIARNDDASTPSFVWATSTLALSTIAAIATPANDGNYTSISVTPAGVEHVSHQDATTGVPEVVYTSGVPGGPHSTVTADPGPTPGTHVGTGGTSIAVDSSGVVHFAHLDGTNGDLRYATNASGNLAASTLDSTGGTGLDAVIRAAPTGNLNILYQYFAAGGGQQLKRALFSGGSWSFESDLLSAPQGILAESFSMALDGVGNPHVAYCHVVSNPPLVYELVYGFRSGTTWTFVPITQADQPAFTRIAVEAAGTVAHVAYLAVGVGELRYATNESGSWTIQPIQSGLGYLGRHHDIGFHPSGGRLHLVYWQPSRGLRYARKDPGGSWVYKLLDAGANVGLHPSMAVDASGTVHVAYRDQAALNLKIGNGTP